MYSVPCRWAGLDLVVCVGAATVTIVGRDGTPIRHPRKRFGERSIDYRHYLPELTKKPQAVRQVLPDLLRDLGQPFPAVWAQFHAAHPDGEAARLFAKVLGQIEAKGLVRRRGAVGHGVGHRRAAGPRLTAPARPVLLSRVGVPPALRDLDVTSGCAADYDGWLAEVRA